MEILSILPFIAVSSWLIMKDNYENIEKENRIDFWIGIGTATWSVAIFSTMIGYIASDFLNKDILIGLAIINPIYFICMMIGAMKTIQITLSVILGTILGPFFIFYHQSGVFYLVVFLQGLLLFYLEKNMATNIVMVIIVTSLATYLSRFLGVLSAERIKETSKIFRWFNCLVLLLASYLISRIVIFPNGSLNEADIKIRALVIFASVLVFI